MPLQQRAAILRRVIPSTLAGACLALAGVAATPASAAVFPLTETFQNSTSSFSGIGASGNSAVLTSGGIDPAGQGWLRLTPASTNKVGYAFYDTAFPTNKGFVASFDYAMYGSSTSLLGADGIMVGMYDGTTKASAFRIGDDGGRLGYGPCNSTPGLKNAVLGVGLDRYGNFAGESECMSNAPVRATDAVTLRGPAPSYSVVATTQVAPTLATYRQPTIGSATPALGRAAANRVTVSSLGDGKVSVRLQRADGTIQTPISGKAIPGTLPSTLKLVVAGTTGSETNVQEVRGVRVTEALDYATTVSDGVANASRTSARVWKVDVANNGPAASTGQDVTMTSSQPLQNVSWTCTATGGAVCLTASGTGLPTGVSSGAMPAGSKLTYTVTGTPGATADYAQLTATVEGTTASATDPDLANNTASDETTISPRIAGQATVGAAANGTLTATVPSAVYGRDATTAYSWQACDADGANCATIGGATSLTYTPSSAYLGKTFRVVMTATNSAGTDSTSALATGPDTSIAQAPAVTGATASFRLSSPTGGVAYDCRLRAPDGSWSAWSACSATPTFSNLAEGDYTLQARARLGTSGVADATPASRTWTVDTTAPSAPEITAPTGTTPVNDATPEITLSGEPGATITIAIDGGPATELVVPESGTVTYTPPTDLGEGTHTIEATQTDPAGNTSAPATGTFAVDLTAPDAPVLGGAADGRPTSDATPTITIEGEPGATAHLTIDGGPAVAIELGEDGRASYTPDEDLADGSHELSVTQTDAAGNTSPPRTATVTVDTTAPAAPTIVTKPDESTTSTTASFTFDGEPGARLVCSIDGGEETTCTDGIADAPAPVGDHTIAVRAIDAAGNESPATTYDWTVVAPSDPGDGSSGGGSGGTFGPAGNGSGDSTGGGSNGGGSNGGDANDGGGSHGGGTNDGGTNGGGATNDGGTKNDGGGSNGGDTNDGGGSNGGGGSNDGGSGSGSGSDGQPSGPGVVGGASTPPACTNLPLAVTNAVKVGRTVRVEGLYLAGSDRAVTIYLGKRKIKAIASNAYGAFATSFAMTPAELRTFTRSPNALRVTGKTRGNQSKSLKLSRQFANKDLKVSGSRVIISGTLASGVRAAGVNTVMLATKASCSGEGRWVKTPVKARVSGNTVTVTAPRPSGPVRADGTITTFYRIQVNIRRVGASKKSKGAKTYTLPRRLLLVAR